MAVVKQEGIIKGAAYLFTGNILNAILGYARLIFLTRLLAPDDFGLFSFLITIVTLVMSFSHIGLSFGESVLIPRSIGNSKRVKNLINTGLTMSVVLVPLFYLLSMVVVVLFYRVYWVLAAVALLYIVAQIGIIFTSIFTGLRLIKLRFYNDLLKNVAWLVFPVLLAHSYGLMGALIGFALSGFSFSIMSLLLYRKTGHKIQLKVQRSIFKELSSLGLALFMINYSAELLRRTDILLIGIFLPIHLVGVYTIAVATSSFAMLVTYSIGAVHLPLLSEFDAKKQYDRVETLLFDVSRIGLFFLLPIVVFGILFARNFFELFFGINYLSAHVPFSILLLFTPFAFLQAIAAQLLQSRKRLKQLGYIAAGMTGLNFVLNLALIFPFGLNGLALATGISQLLGFLITLHYARGELSIKLPLSAFSKQIVSILFAGGVFIQLQSLTTNLWFQIIGGLTSSFIIYVVISLLIGGIHLGDIENILKKISSTS